MFSAIGFLMVVWATVEAGLSGSTTARAREYLAAPVIRAILCGLVAGTCAIGRPLAVFREVLLYAAQPGQPSHAAGVMAVGVLGTVLLPLSAVLITTAIIGTRGHSPKDGAASSLLPAAAIGGGGVFLLFYWGFSRVWPAFGRRGFTLGIYS